MEKPKFGKTDCLALEWCKFFSDMLYQYFGDDFDPMVASRICAADVTQEELDKIIKKYPTLPQLIESRKNVKSAIEDFDCFTMMMSWGKNKQVYKFDRDFTNELMKTDNLRFTKNMFDFLPHKYLYIDISDNKELCESLYAKGFFVKVEKIPKSIDSRICKTANISERIKNCDKWCFHICRISETQYSYDVLFLPNTDESIDAKDLIKESKVRYVINPLNNKDKSTYIDFDVELLHKVVQHTVTYLTSDKQDIKESELTKRTYKEPSKTLKRPKDKFSEVKTWDVGVRYGDAFRKWKSEEPKYRSVSTGTGRKVRPHSRMAHYNYYWYGKRNSENRVLRRVWIDELFINVDKDKTEDLPVVIHKVKNDKSNIERD